MTRIAEIADRLLRLAKRREDEGIYTDAALCEEAAELLSTPANPAQGVSEAMNDIKDVYQDMMQGSSFRERLEVAHASLTAAIGAGNEWQDVLSSSKPFGFDPATGFFHADDSGAPSSCVFYVPKDDAIGAGWQAVALPPITERGLQGQIMDAAWPEFGGNMQTAEFWNDFGAGVEFTLKAIAHPAPSGQAVADWQRIDDALVSCAGLLRTLCKDEIGDTAAAGLEYVRSAIAHPVHPGWRTIETAPKDGTLILLAKAGDPDWPLRCRRWQDTHWRGQDAEDATHWMPLPAAPPPRRRESKMVKLTSHEIEVLEMLAGTRPLEWGARVSACIESLHGNGCVYVTKSGGVPLLTDKGRAALADGGRDAG